MAVLEAVSRGRSLSSLPAGGSAIFFGRCTYNLHLLQGFHIKVCRALVVSQYKTSKNAVTKDSTENGSESISAIASNSLPSKRKMVEAEISLFLTSRGMTHLQAVKIISKLSWCIELVICDVQASRRRWDVHAIKSKIILYLEALLRENKESLLRLIEPTPSTGELQLDLFHLIEHLNLTRIKLYVNLLLDFGASESTVAKILRKFPRFCSTSLENIEPIVSLLVSHGLNKDKLPKVIDSRPQIFQATYEKALLNLNYLRGLGLSKDQIGKVVEKFPSILARSIDSLETKVEYFQALGVNVVKFVSSYPKILSLSLEENIKPMTEFFLDVGFSEEELALMISRYGGLYGFSLERNIMPKWRFFLETGYERDVLVASPAYFSCSLEKRIKPRYEKMVEAGVRLPFSCVVSIRDAEFERILAKKSCLSSTAN